MPRVGQVTAAVWEERSWQSAVWVDGVIAAVETVEGLVHGHVGLIPRIVGDRGWMVMHLPTDRVLCSVKDLEDAKRIGEDVETRLFLLLREKRVPQLLASLPAWVRHWLKWVDQRDAYVSPEEAGA